LIAGFSLKARLTLWSLLVLALMLGVGGFFSFYAQDRQLHLNLDAELLTTARNLDWLFSQIDPAETRQTEFCRLLDQYPLPYGKKLAISLFSPEGDLICSKPNPLHRKLELLPPEKKGLQSGKFLFSTASDENNQTLRMLTVPLASRGGQALFLQLDSSLLPVKDQLQRIAISLTLGIFLTLTAFSLLFWRKTDRLASPLVRFTDHLEQTRDENLKPYQFPSTTGNELKKLFRSYNKLITRLARSLQRSRQFSADVTHELRTPLTILKGETELALRKDKTKEQLLQTLDSNMTEIFRMSHLIEDLLLLSKSELGEIPLKMEALNLKNMLSELFNHAQILAEEKRIRVDMQGIDEQISLFADEKRLRQVFLNLLANAIKYTPEEGRVSIICQREGDQIQVAIEDTGIGIDSQHQEFIFDRFYRIDKTRNRDDGGSGLGLAIAKWIVDAHKGSITVASTPGQGSRFTVLLPLTSLSGSRPAVN